MQYLGVFETISPDGKMDIAQTLLISVVGFAIVFVVLGFLAVFVFGMGKVFDTLQKKKEDKTEAVAVISAENKTVSGNPLPSNQSIGDLTLVNVTEEEAAVIMAVTSSKSGIPLNRLKFNSIKCLEDNK